MPGYRRILLKLSGQSLAGPQGYGIHVPTMSALVEELKTLHDDRREVGIVIGGGNIFRGVAGAAAGLDRTAGDQVGMLATVMNCLALQGALEARGVPARLMSALFMPQVCEPFVKRRAVEELAAGRFVLFAAGTGNPFFTTDSAAALRAAEIGADVLLKATRVDGVYDRDPEKFPDAIRHAGLTYQDVLARDLRVLDSSAVALCRDARIPLLVFNLHQPGNILKAARGVPLGTVISTTGERPDAAAPQPTHEEAKPWKP